MPTENLIDPRKGFVPRYLPWLLALASFGVYLLTLEHWTSSYNVADVARISGWQWRPLLMRPLTFLVTLPFHLLPASAVPLVLDCFSAVCAALTLALLARSVALLPQDRTEAQRKREKSDYSFLTIPTAWLPPVFAVGVCGLQLTFWEHATNFSGEMFDLLIFAFVICSLLEYRLDERKSRLYLMAFVYGAGMAENWAMIGFFPLFLVAIIWIRGLGILNLRFVSRMLLCGVAGLLLYFLLPLMALISGKEPITFWQALDVNLVPAHNVLKSIIFCIFNPGQTLPYVMLVLVYLVPLVIIAIRWSATFGDESLIGSAIASFILHIAHAAFLGFFIWMAFDPQFSPRVLGNGIPLLTFYYLGALAIGYFAGYFLLIFGKEEILKRPSRKKPPFQALNKPVVAGVWFLATITVIGLTYRNLPLIHITNDDTVHQYAKLTEENLPRTGGYLLSDDPYRLFFICSALVQDGRDKEFVPLDTSSLTIPAYHLYLHRHYPQKWPDLVSGKKIGSIYPPGLVQLLTALSRTNDLYYLHPSFGYYFEEFYLEPHGLVYRMKPLPSDTLLPPDPSPNLIAENQNFWTNDAASALAKVANTIAPPDPNAPISAGEYILLRLHISREPNLKSARQVAGYYSRSLNYWGVLLQHAGQLNWAATNFENALVFNPDNVVAQINLAFNKKLQTGSPVTIDLSQVSTDQFGKYATLVDVLNANGPFDDPNYCFAYGLELFKSNGFIRQSVAQFERVRELAPDFLPARLMLAQDYLIYHLPQRVLAVLHEPLKNPGRFSLNETNDIGMNAMVASAYLQENDPARGIKLIDTELVHQPDNNRVLVSAAQFFIGNGLYTNAMAVINQKLKIDPDNPAWLYDKGYVAMELKDYPTAISALDHVLEIQTNNENALFNRAIANLDSGRLDAAQTDYLRLQLVASNSPPIVYGLGEIARLKGETNDAIRYYQIYLSQVNTNAAEAKMVAARLKSLKQ